MEQYLRIALWMFLVMGYVQARPTPEVPLDLCFDCLKSVSCEPNVTFTSPSNVKTECYNAALTTFKDQLVLANKTCTDKEDRTGEAVNVLSEFQPDDSTSCNWEKKQFTDFLMDFSDFINRLNSKASAE